MTFNPSEISKDSPPFEKGKIRKVEGGLYELMAGSISREQAAATEKFLGIGDSYSIGFGIGEKLYGAISIFVREGFALKYESALETLANYFSIAIHRKMMTLALKESEEKYRVLFYSFPLGINVTDGEGNILEANKIAEEILGLSRDVQAERTINGEEWEIIRLDGSPMPPEEFASVKALEENRMVSDVRMGIVRPDKTTWISVTAAPLPIENYGVVVTYVDITEAVLAQEELKRISKLESLGIVAGGIAHNFKNILTSVALSVELAKKRPDRSAEMLGKIEKSIDKAAALANRFQTFYRGDEPVKRDINVNHVIDEAIAMGISGSNINVVRNYENKIRSVSADPKQIHEVILNLILNARYAMSDKGLITVNTRNIDLGDGEQHILGPGHYVRITISDEGGGISEHIRDKIFEPFFTTRQEGHGLGLSSAQLIVRKHGGSIDFDTEPGKGTDFYIYLPAKNGYDTAADYSEKESAKMKDSYHVLLMDDEDDIREIFTDIAEEFGIRMETVDGPESAIDKYRQSLDNGDRYDGVILDLTIRGSKIGGEEVLNNIKEIDPAVKAFVFSGHSTKPIVANYQEYGFAGRIEKPIDIDQFVNELNKVLPIK
jgi:PAS domain S-box-containing protein